jgi:quercetin dioxygenase-like cupin family protein
MEATLALAEYAPGGRSAAHYHPGPVFAYVLEGSVRSQLKGQAPVTYHARQSWDESPKQRHLVSRNASATEPAKLLAFVISKKEEQVVVPIG